MKLTQEILDLAAQVAKAHKLAEVFYTENGEFFSSAREARNNKAKAVRAFPAPSLKSKAEDVDPVSSEETKGNSLDEQNGHTAEATGTAELKVTISETEPAKVEPVVEPAKAEETKQAETEAEPKKAAAPKPVKPVTPAKVEPVVEPAKAEETKQAETQEPTV